MRILFVIPVLAGAGAEKFISNLLVELKYSNVDVHLYLIRGVVDKIGQRLLQRIKKAGIKVYNGNGKDIHSVGEVLSFVQVCRELQPDILFANLQISRFYVIIARLILFYMPLKLVHRIENTQFYGNNPKLLFKFLDIFFVSTISIAPPVSRAYLDVVGQTAIKKIHMIPNGSNEKPVCAAVANFKMGSDLIIVNVGRIGKNNFSYNGLQDNFRSAQKGHSVMIDAVAKLKTRNKISSMKVRFIGDGDLKSDAENYASKMNIDSHIVFLGNIDNVSKELEDSHVFLFASKFEGMPNALVEAAQHGLPIIASNIPEIRWLAPKSGWILVDPEDEEGFADALFEVYTNYQKFRAEAIKNAEYFQNEFSVHAAAKKYKKHLETVFQND